MGGILHRLHCFCEGLHAYAHDEKVHNDGQSYAVAHREAQRSLVGIGILLAAAVGMPWLAARKRKLAAITSSAALKADAAESALCGYMAWIALAGLAVNAIWVKSWADPLAASALTPLILREGWEAFKSSKLCCD